jgi:circadian clock protein KaiB
MKPRVSTKAFERARKVPVKKVLLRLYVSGSSDRSIRAIENIKDICATHLEGRCELVIVDIHKQPELAREDDVLAVPALIRRAPLPRRRFIGDLSDRAVVLNGLGLDLNRK